MPVTRLNHAVLDVRDEQRSVAFYQATPGGIGISIPVAR